MTSRIQMSVGAVLYAAFFVSQLALADTRIAFIEAKDSGARNRVSDFGLAIEGVNDEGVWVVADSTIIANARQGGLAILSDTPADTVVSTFDFPEKDSRYHNFAETTAYLKDLQMKYADNARIVSIGKSLQGRDIWALHINTDPAALADSQSNKPGIVYLGNHHAREHLTNEVSLLLAKHFLENREAGRLGSLVDQRDIWIIPMVNPDGVEFDTDGGRYRYWRKNRRQNASSSSWGVDLNRNYGYKWGTGGSSSDPGSEVYMGTEPFSEPETQAVRDFVINHPNLTMMLSFHTYSELVLYPWGNTNSSIDNAKDRAVFETMARTMAQWNHYKPMQSSGLYIASGDTTDWAYGERGIFAFTFEMSPKDGAFGAGFYPGVAMIDKAFADNLQPCLYMLDLADDPYRATAASTGVFQLDLSAMGEWFRLGN